MKLNSYPFKCMEVLGNEVKHGIIEALKEKPMTVRELCERLEKEQSLVSHALQSLRECSFVDFEQKGKEREYYLKSGIFTEKQNKPLFEILEEHAAVNCKHKPKEEKKTCYINKRGFV